jgi:PAS domain S-box-containing protein
MDGVSLLTFLDAPCLVIDPEGRVVYANPAFERRFGDVDDGVQGRELVALFEGGGREAVLQAVAEVCASGRTARFRMREERRGYLGLASPIEAGGESQARVGVVLLLLDEPAIDAKLQAVHREMEEPLEEARAAFEQLIDQTGGRRNEAFRSAVERGMSSLGRARKWSDELGAALCGRSGEAAVDARLDPVRMVHEVAARVGDAFESAGLQLDLLVPAQLPAACGDPDILEAALVRLLRLRLATAESGSTLTLSARTMGGGGRRAVLVTLVDRPRGSVDDETEGREPQSLCEAVAPHGGRVHTVRIARAGRATAIRLPLATGPA